MEFEDTLLTVDEYNLITDDESYRGNERCEERLVKAQAKKTAEMYMTEFHRLSLLAHCHYCGATFTVDNAADANIANHIQTCKKHPLNIERTEHQKQTKILFRELEAAAIHTKTEMMFLHKRWRQLKKKWLGGKSMKTSKRRTLKTKVEQCSHCQFNDLARIPKGLDPCISPTGIEIRNGLCLSKSN